MNAKLTKKLSALGAGIATLVYLGIQEVLKTVPEVPVGDKVVQADILSTIEKLMASGNISALKLLTAGSIIAIFLILTTKKNKTDKLP